MVIVTVAGIVTFGAWTVTVLVGYVRRRLEDRRSVADPFVPSRVYIDERYGGADADSSRRTGNPGPSPDRAYLRGAREHNSRTRWGIWIP